MDARCDPRCRLGAAEVGARLPVDEVGDAHPEHIEDDRDVRLEREHVVVRLALAGVVDQAVGDEERHLHTSEQEHGHGEVVDLEDGHEDRVDREVHDDGLLGLREGPDHLHWPKAGRGISETLARTLQAAGSSTRG